MKYKLDKCNHLIIVNVILDKCNHYHLGSGKFSIPSNYSLLQEKRAASQNIYLVSPMSVITVREFEAELGWIKAQSTKSNRKDEWANGPWGKMTARVKYKAGRGKWSRYLRKGVGLENRIQ